jgi:lysyl-tRNA synthetase, class II
MQEVVEPGAREGRVAKRPVRRRATAARLATGIATALAGGLSVGSAITSDVPWRAQFLLEVEPSAARGLGHVLAAAGGFALIYLGWGIVRGRRRAAHAASIVLVALAVIHAVKGLDYEESAVALTLAVLIQANRRACRRGGPPRAGLIAGTAAVGAVAAAYMLDTAALLVSERARGLGSALTKSWGALTSGAWWLSSGEPIAIALDALVVLALIASALFLRALLRPAEGRNGHTWEDHVRAAQLVARYGGDSLDPFTLREDKAFHFAHGGFIAYRVLRETAVASGDPIGPPGSVAAIVADFADFAASRGWDVVFTAVSPRCLDEFRALGFRTLCIGEEAVVRPSDFSLEGRAIRKVRQAVARVERRGWRVDVVDGLLPGGPLAAELDAVERGWSGRRPRLQGFAMSLGRLWGAPEDADAVYVVARRPDGTLSAFLRFVRCGEGLSLDVMRRSGEAPNGLYEAMIVNVLQWAATRGTDAVSLNFAGFSHVMSDRRELTRSQRLLRFALTQAHGRFQLERLARFNDKFTPEWRPRFLVYGARTYLPLAALRVLQAEAYLRPPRARPLKHCWRPLPYPVDPPTPLSQREASQAG